MSVLAYQYRWRIVGVDLISNQQDCMWPDMFTFLLTCRQPVTNGVKHVSLLISRFTAGAVGNAQRLTSALIEGTTVLYWRCGLPREWFLTVGGNKLIAIPRTRLQPLQLWSCIVASSHHHRRYRSGDNIPL